MDCSGNGYFSGDTSQGFFRELGLPISEYLANKRMEVAKRMFLETSDRCFEICRAIGYRREDCCARAFRKFTGISMEQYRGASYLQRKCITANEYNSMSLKCKP
ncbi:MAG: helix-turn-helix domain-containing protein [Ignavibacterium sp.]